MQMSIWAEKLQRVWKSFYFLSLLTVSLLLLNPPVSDGYIAKRYTIPQIVKEK